MDSGFFDFTITVADVALAFVGVGGGAYAGGRAVQVARHRADHRLRLLTDLLPEVQKINASRYERFAHYELARTVVQLLPYPERTLWRATEATIDAEYDRIRNDDEASDAITDALADVHRAYSEAPRLDERIMLEEEQIRLSFALIRGAFEVRVPLETLSVYLSWKLRPTISRRWKARLLAAQLRLAWRPGASMPDQRQPGHL